jgi:hypothetical protein
VVRPAPRGNGQALRPNCTSAPRRHVSVGDRQDGLHLVDCASSPGLPSLRRPSVESTEREGDAARAAAGPGARRRWPPRVNRTPTTSGDGWNRWRPRSSTTSREPPARFSTSRRDSLRGAPCQASARSASTAKRGRLVGGNGARPCSSQRTGDLRIRQQGPRGVRRSPGRSSPAPLHLRRSPRTHRRMRGVPREAARSEGVVQRRRSARGAAGGPRGSTLAGPPAHLGEARLLGAANRARPLACASSYGRRGGCLGARRGSARLHARK